MAELRGLPAFTRPRRRRGRQPATAPPDDRRRGVRRRDHRRDAARCSSPTRTTRPAPRCAPTSCVGSSPPSPGDLPRRVDEAYREFVTGADVPDAIACFGDRPNVAVLRTFSKAYGLAALRVGLPRRPTRVVVAVDRTHRVAVRRERRRPGGGAIASLDHDDEAMARVAAPCVAERTRCRRRAAAARARGARRAGQLRVAAGGDAARTAGAGAGATRRRHPSVRRGRRPGHGDDPAEDDRFLAALGRRPTRSTSTRRGAADRRRGPRRPAGSRLDAVDGAALAMAGATTAPGCHRAEPQAGERWDAGQVWAHLAEFGAYWLAELDTIVDGRRRPIRCRSAGRSVDPARIAAIEDRTHRVDPRPSSRDPCGDRRSPRPRLCRS